jgi:hypothetical protein
MANRASIHPACDAVYKLGGGAIAHNSFVSGRWYGFCTRARVYRMCVYMGVGKSRRRRRWAMLEVEMMST